jgi:hypothetical protein
LYGAALGSSHRPRPDDPHGWATRRAQCACAHDAAAAAFSSASATGCSQMIEAVMSSLYAPSTSNHASAAFAMRWWHASVTPLPLARNASTICTACHDASHRAHGRLSSSKGASLEAHAGCTSAAQQGHGQWHGSQWVYAASGCTEWHPHLVRADELPHAVRRDDLTHAAEATSPPLSTRQVHSKPSPRTHVSRTSRGASERLAAPGSPKHGCKCGSPSCAPGSGRRA